MSITNSSAIALGVAVAAFITGWWQGARSTEQEWLAKVNEARAEIARIETSHSQEVLDLERKYQAHILELDQAAVQAKAEAQDEISRLNQLIDTYRVRDNAQRTDAANSMPAVTRITCKPNTEYINRWRRAFIKLSELARDLAVERDEIARMKNELVRTYQDIRNAAQVTEKQAQGF